MNCKKCNTENEDDFLYCVSCGERLDGKLVCPSCKTVCEPDMLFCTNCATRLDGKIKCSNCGNFNEPKYTFCPICGEKVVLKTAASPLVKKKNTSSNIISSDEQYNGNSKVCAALNSLKDNRIYQICKMSFITAISFILFVISFFSLNSIPLNAIIPVGFSNGFQISSINYIESIGIAINPMTQEEAQQDYIQYILEKGINPDTVESPDSIMRLTKGYNILKLAITEESVKESPQIRATFIIIGITMLLYILATLAFFITMLVKLLLLIIAKHPMPTNKLIAPALLVPLLLVFLLSGYISSSFGGFSNMGSSAIMTIVFCCIGLFSILFDKFIITQSDVELGTVITRGVSFVICGIMIAVAAGGFIKTTFTPTSDQNSMIKKERPISFVITAMSFYDANNIENSIIDNENVTDSTISRKDIKTYLAEIDSMINSFSSIEGLKPTVEQKQMILASSGLPFYLFSLKECGDSCAPFRTMNLFVPTIFLLALISFSITCYFSLTDVLIKKKKSVLAILHIVNFALFAMLLIFPIINVANLAVIVKDLKAVTSLKFAIAPALISLGVLSLINMLQHFIVSKVVTKKFSNKIEINEGDLK